MTTVRRSRPIDPIANSTNRLIESLVTRTRSQEIDWRARVATAQQAEAAWELQRCARAAGTPTPDAPESNPAEYSPRVYHCRRSGTIARSAEELQVFSRIVERWKSRMENHK